VRRAPSQHNKKMSGDGVAADAKDVIIVYPRDEGQGVKVGEVVRGGGQGHRGPTSFLPSKPSMEVKREELPLTIAVILHAADGCPHFEPGTLLHSTAVGSSADDTAECRNGLIEYLVSKGGNSVLDKYRFVFLVVFVGGGRDPTIDCAFRLTSATREPERVDGLDLDIEKLCEDNRWGWQSYGYSLASQKREIGKNALIKTQADKIAKLTKTIARGKKKAELKDAQHSSGLKVLKANVIACLEGVGGHGGGGGQVGQVGRLLPPLSPTST
jgi:hypothetical protein